MSGISGCSADRKDAENATDPATVETTVSTAPTPEGSPTPPPTPDNRSRAERLAESKRRVQELIRQKKLEEAAKNGTQPPGTETQYQ